MDDDIDRDYIFRVVETRAREKLDAGLITQEEFESIVEKHKDHNTTNPQQSSKTFSEGEQISNKLLLLVGDVLERGETAQMTGRGVLLLGSQGASQIVGLAVLTDLRVLFIAEDAVNSAEEPESETLLSRVRVLPMTESFPLHSIQTTSFSKGTSSRMVKRRSTLKDAPMDSTNFEESMVLERASSWTVTLTSKFGRTIQLLFTEDDNSGDHHQLPASSGAAAPQPCALFCEFLKDKLDSLMRNPGAYVFAPRAVAAAIASTTSPSNTSSSSMLEGGLNKVNNTLPLKDNDITAWNTWRGYDPVVEYKRMGVDTSVCKGGGSGDLNQNSMWSLTRLNEAYSMSPTYPAILAVPSACSTSLLLDAAKFRSKGRIPSLSWRCTKTGVTISRCAQPLSGLRVYAGAGRNKSDEALVRALWYSSAPPVQTTQGGEAPHLILDCRPLMNAQANAMAGRGYENMAIYGPRKVVKEKNNQSSSKESNSAPEVDEVGLALAEAAASAANEKLREGLITEEEYQQLLRQNRIFHGDLLGETDTSDGTSSVATTSAADTQGEGTQYSANADRTIGSGPICELVFADIENIHVQRRCFRELLQVCNDNSDSNTQRNELDIGVLDVSMNDALASQSLSWLKQVSSILTAARGVASAMRLDKRSTLVHCSDGWDRTAQISSLVMLLLDPYYRTIKGLGVLIEKEWLSYGHQFASRTGHGNVKMKNTGNLSPIFYQWMDCIWQITEQLPEHFEYDGRLLLAILDLMVSCHFGNFLYNSERERVENRLFEKTESIWAYIEAHQLDFLNPLYFKRTAFATSSMTNSLDSSNSNKDEEFENTTLFPVVSVKRLRLWTCLFQRWDVSSKGKVHVSNQDLSKVKLEATPSLGVTEMLIQRIAQLERQVKDMQTSEASGAGKGVGDGGGGDSNGGVSGLVCMPPPATNALSAQSRRYSSFATSQHTEGVDAFTRRLCPSFAGSVHGYAWTTIANNLEQVTSSQSDQGSSSSMLNNQGEESNQGGSGGGGATSASNHSQGDGGGARAEGAHKMASNVWVPDELAFKCAKCSISFTVFTRKHHCRGCGLCFCSSCAPLRKLPRLSFTPSNLPGDEDGKQRSGGFGDLSTLNEEDVVGGETLGEGPALGTGIGGAQQLSPRRGGKHMRERLCLNCFVLKTAGAGSMPSGGRTFSLSSSASGLGKAMKGWSPLRNFKTKQSTSSMLRNEVEKKGVSDGKFSDDEDDEEEDDGMDGKIILDDFSADSDRRVSVLKAAGLEEFLDSMTEFGFETIEDLLEPGLVNDEDLMSDFIGMNSEQVSQFRKAIADYRRALDKYEASRMSAHFM